jgi:hypothetical protein
VTALPHKASDPPSRDDHTEMLNMSRIQTPHQHDRIGDVAMLFEAVTTILVQVPNCYRILGHSPLVAKVLIPFNAVAQFQGAGSVRTVRLKEMAVIRPAM